MIFARLQVAMYDARGMRSGQRACDLRSVFDRLRQRKAAALETRSQSLTFHKFHHQIVVTYIVERTDVGVIQPGDGSGFELETLTESISKHLDGDAAMKSCVGGAEDASHAALSQRRLDPVRADRGRNWPVFVRVDWRGRIVQQAGPLARRNHLFNLFAQSGIGSGQQGRAFGRALLDIREEPLDLLPSLWSQGCLFRHDTARAGHPEIGGISAGTAHPCCVKSRRNLEDPSRISRW
jgi:hypothetical protein